MSDASRGKLRKAKESISERFNAVTPKHRKKSQKAENEESLKNASESANLGQGMVVKRKFDSYADRLESPLTPKLVHMKLSEDEENLPNAKRSRTPLSERQRKSEDITIVSLPNFNGITCASLFRLEQGSSSFLNFRAIFRFFLLCARVAANVQRLLA